MQSCGFAVGGVGVQAAGGIVEVDLVFLRNETYRLSAIPILFAVWNSPLAVPLTTYAHRMDPVGEQRQ